MFDELSIFDVIRVFFTLASPIVFTVGILLLFSPLTYKKIERALSKEIGGTGKKVIAGLEDYIDTFHEWILLKIRILFGLICIISSMMFFFMLRR